MPSTVLAMRELTVAVLCLRSMMFIAGEPSGTYEQKEQQTTTTVKTCDDSIGKSPARRCNSNASRDGDCAPHDDAITMAHHDDAIMMGRAAAHSRD